MLKKGKAKKIVALLLAFVVVATMTEWPMIAKADSSVTVSSGTWTSSDATVSSATVDGSGVLQVTKDNLKESTTITNSETYTVDVSTVKYDFELQWSMVYRSQNSNCTARLDITLYDSSGNALEEGTITGDRVMLSREDEYSDWDELVTIATVPAETAQVSYKLILSSGTADLQVKSVSAVVASDIAKEDKSAETGWTAQEVWYPEDETEDCIKQFRYFRIKVELETTLKANTDFRIQVIADDSLSLRYEGERKADCLYVNEQFVDSSYRTEIKENGKRILSFSLNTTEFGLVDKTEFYICARVINISANAGLILQAYGIQGESKQAFEYTKVVETNAKTTTVSKLGITGALDWTEYVETDTTWYTNNYVEDDSWVAADERGTVPYGNLGDLPFDWKYSDATKGFYYQDSADANTTVSVEAGAKFTVTKTVSTRYFTGDIKAQLYLPDDEGCTDVNCVKKKCNVVATIPVTVTVEEGKSASENKGLYFTATIPDYVPAGTYCMRLLGARYLNTTTTGNVGSNILATVTVTNNGTAAVTSQVRSTDNGIRLQIGGENVSPVLYLMADRDAYYSYETMSTFANTGVELYTNFGGRLDGDNDSDPIWTAEETIDTAVLDRDIYQTLDLNPNAMLIVNINMDAPEWWKDANPDELIIGSDGSTIDEVSFASTEYREDASLILEKIIDHLSTASYKHRICGIRLSGGNTSEWMHYTDSNGHTGDYSTPMKTAYYNAYGSETLPTVAERASGDFGALLSSSTQQAVIQYNELMSKVITDSILVYAGTAKIAMQENNVSWVVGVYNGYMWQENTAGGIGKTHGTCETLLDSTYIDFVSSPINYNERISGYSTSYMTLTESIAAHGKLYIAEQDNRTVYADYSVVAGRTDALGKTYTVDDTIAQLKRDASMDLVKGTGMWFYDMLGGWYDNDDIEETLKAVKDEYDESLALNTSTNSEVAVFVGSETYNYLANGSLNSSTNDSYKIMSQLYAAQKVELSKMGTSYDTYMIEDLCSSNVNTDWSQYKLSIILSPFELTSTEISAIQTKLQKNDNYILWVYMPGVSDGSEMDEAHITAVTGITTKLYTPSGWSSTFADITMSATIKNTAFGTVGDTYGSLYESSDTKAKVPYISDSGATELATYAEISGFLTSVAFSEQPAAAMKDMGTYTSVYSAIPNVPADSLRALCEAAGVHIYSEDKNTVVETNESYISVYSQVAGEQTITLPAASEGKVLTVYDVFKGEEVEVTEGSNVNTITVTLAADETKLYRVTEGEVVYANADFVGGLVTNPIFMDWTDGVPTGYTINSSATVTDTSEEINGDLYKIAIVQRNETASSDAEDPYLQYSATLEAGKTYDITFTGNYVKDLGGLYFYVLDSNNTIQSSNDIKKSVLQNWSAVTLSYTATTTGIHSFKWRLNSNSTEVALKITNFGIYEQTTELDYINLDFKGKLISNPVFDDWSDGVPTDYSIGTSTKVESTYEEVTDGYYKTITMSGTKQENSTDDSSNRGNVYLEYTINLEPGIYRLSFEGKYTHGTQGSMYFYVYNSSNTPLTMDNASNNQIAKATQTELQTVVREFTIGENEAGTYRLRWRLVDADTAASYELTNVCLEANPDYINADFDGVLFTNPIFENWNEEGTTPTDCTTAEYAAAEHVRFGTDEGCLSAMKITTTFVSETSGDYNDSGNTYVYYTANLEIGKTYRLTYDAYFQSGTSGGGYCKLYEGGKTEIDNGGALMSSSAKQWATYEREFTLTSASTMEIRFRIASPSTDVALYVTNVKLEVIGYGTMINNGDFSLVSDGVYTDWSTGAEAVQADNLLPSGDFESDTATWQFVVGSADGEKDIVTEENGNHILQLNRNSGTLLCRYMKQITIDPNKTYTISYRFKGDDGSRIWMHMSDRDSTGQLAAQNFDNTNPRQPLENWQTATITYAPTAGSTYTYLSVSITNGTGYVYVDDIVITEGEVTNTPSLTATTVSGINGVSLSGGNGCYLQTTTKYSTLTNATYILKFNAAMTNSSTVKVSLYDDSNTLLSTDLSLATTAQTYKYLIAPVTSSLSNLRFMLSDAETLSVGDVSLELNRGDFDDDGELSDDDFTTMRKSVVGSAEETDSAYSDLTGDGKTSAVDIIRMKLYEKGLK